jgi:hypothetical protein
MLPSSSSSVWRALVWLPASLLSSNDCFWRRFVIALYNCHVDVIRAASTISAPMTSVISFGAIGEERFGSFVLEEDFHLDVALDHWAINIVRLVAVRESSHKEHVAFHVGDQTSCFGL